jgi:hypothetical protein
MKNFDKNNIDRILKIDRRIKSYKGIEDLLDIDLQKKYDQTVNWQEIDEGVSENSQETENEQK